MALTIKICGLRTPETLDVALESGADQVGFVFFAPSPRNLGLTEARVLSARVGSRAGKVALTVDANNETLADIIEAVKPDMLQLHGTETPDRVQVIRSRFGLPVMKALPIATRADLSPIREYAKVADRLLFDARAPETATRPGGLGKSFDWSLLAGLDAGVPFMLSGGLDPANVAEAIRTAKPWGVDVSSGVERAPGEKDADKIRAFIRAARMTEPLLLDAAKIVSTS
jgi:phosphoribosylanthranilate isomerase